MVLHSEASATRSFLSVARGEASVGMRSPSSGEILLRSRGSSLGPDIRGARDPREYGDVVADKLVERLGAHRARRHADRGEALARFGVAQYVHDLAVELGHDGARHARGG